MSAAAAEGEVAGASNEWEGAEEELEEAGEEEEQEEELEGKEEEKGEEERGEEARGRREESKQNGGAGVRDAAKGRAPKTWCEMSWNEDEDDQVDRGGKGLGSTATGNWNATARLHFHCCDAPYYRIRHIPGAFY